MNDLEFVRKCVSGDKQAWCEFVDKYSRLIYNYIHSVIKIQGLDELAQDSIDDLFQEVFTSLIKDNFKKLKSFKARNGSSLASWLRQVSVNLTIDYIRKSRPSVSLDQEIDDGFSLKDVIMDESGSVSDKLSDEERLAQLEECIQELDDDDKYFLELHINRGLRLEDLKIILQLSRQAVDMRKFRLINRLRDCFKSKGFQLDL